MKKKLLKLISACFAVVLATTVFSSPYFGQPPQKSERSLNPETAELVKKGFAAIRNGDFRYAPEMDALGEKIIPYLEPYIFDSNQLVRSETAFHLISSYTPEGSILLAKILADKDSFKYTADKIYESLKPSTLSKSPAIHSALLKNFSEGRYSLTSVLLLKNFPGAATEQALEKIKRDLGDKIETLPIQFLDLRISLAVNLALCSINNSNGCKDLDDQLRTASVNEAFFLLLMLDDIRNRPVLQNLQKIMLADKRIYTSTQSELIYKNSEGAVRFAQPKSRICDLAVDFLIRRFGLKMNFKTEKEVYLPTEINELQKKLNRLLA